MKPLSPSDCEKMKRLRQLLDDELDHVVYHAYPPMKGDCRMSWWERMKMWWMNRIG